MGNRDERKKRLSENIHALQTELQDIFQKERLDKNLSIIGKYYCWDVDADYHYARYIWVNDVDENGNLLGSYFEVHMNAVKFSFWKAELWDADEILRSSEEITPEEFNKRREQELKKLNLQ